MAATARTGLHERQALQAARDLSNKKGCFCMRILGYFVGTALSVAALAPMDCSATLMGTTRYYCRTGAVTVEGTTSYTTTCWSETTITDTSGEAVTYTQPIGGGGGGGAGVIQAPNNPYQSETGATCSDETAVRQNHAQQDVNWYLKDKTFFSRPPAGTIYIVTYGNGQKEGWIATGTVGTNAVYPQPATGAYACN